MNEGGLGKLHSIQIHISVAYPFFLVAEIVKNLVCNAEDPSSIPGLGRSPGEGSGNLFQYSCLGNTMDRGAWWGTVHGITKSWTRLSEFHFSSSLFCFLNGSEAGL